MDQFSLFDDLFTQINPPKTETKVGKNKSNYYLDTLPKKVQEAIWQHVLEGETSAYSISELLPTNLLPADRQENYITGKPMIYLYVCVFLDEMVKEGKLHLMQKSQADRIYRLDLRE